MSMVPNTTNLEYLNNWKAYTSINTIDMAITFDKSTGPKIRLKPFFVNILYFPPAKEETNHIPAKYRNGMVY